MVENCLLYTSIVLVGGIVGINVFIVLLLGILSGSIIVVAEGAVAATDPVSYTHLATASPRTRPEKSSAKPRAATGNGGAFHR